MSSPKKILILIILILLIILIWLVYNVFTQEQTTEQIKPESNLIGAVIPTTQTTPQKLTQLTNRPILGLAIANNKLKFFDKTTGHIFEMALDGTREKEIIASDIPSLVSAKWNTDSTKAIIKTTEKQYFYDYATNQVVLIDFQNPVWFKNKIIYQCSQGICQSNADSNTEELIFQTPIQDINIITADKIYFYPKPSALAQSTVFSINPLKKVLGPYQGLIFKNPDLYSIGIKPHNTIADKCIANYCAVPKKWPDNMLIPDDYYKNLFNTQDTFLNIKTKKEIIQTSYDVQNLLFNNNKLYFTDKTTNYLYMIRLDEE